MADIERTWIKDAFWETPEKNQLNCISEHKEGFKDVRQVHKLKRGDPLFDECVEALTEKHIDVNTDRRVNKKFREQEQQRQLEINKRKAQKLEELFNYKLETFEVEEIKESRNRILKSKLRRSKSIPEVNLYAIMILQDKLENETE
tara:strand:- start:424 stop:861 length:438 start_codon:yes stop_codon:yes gene_type:complete